MKNSFLIAFIIVLFGPAVWAAKTGPDKRIPQMPAIAPIGYDYDVAEETKMAKEILAKYLDNKNEKRKVAGGLANPTESDLSNDDDYKEKSFKHFRDTFLSISTPEQIEALLSKFDENVTSKDYPNSAGFKLFSSYPVDVQFVLNQLILLRPMRGLFHRVENIFKQEKRYFSYAIFVKIMKDLAAKLELQVPTDEWRAGFNYLMIPDPDQVRGKPFNLVSDFQNFLAGPMTNAVEKSVIRTRLMLGETRKLTSGEFVFDRRLTYGDGTFTGDLDRYRSVGTGELMLQMVYLKRSLYLMQFFSAYNVDQFMAVQDDLEKMKLKGEATDWLNKQAEGLFSIPQDVMKVGFTDQTRTAILNKYPHFMELRGLVTGKPVKEAYGATLMNKGWTYLTELITHRKNTWPILKGRDDRPTQFFNAAVLKDDPRAVDACIADADRMINAGGQGWAELHSVVTGDFVKVNLREFFTNPPETMKIFLPNQFDTKGGRHITPANGLTYRNYFYGRATGWDTSKYSSYLVLEGNRDKTENGILPNSLATAFTIASQSWGGKGIAHALYFYVK